MNSPVMSRDEAFAICEKVLASSKAEQTEVLVLGGNNALTRFTNNYIHQNVASNGVTVQVRAITEKKIGVASGNDLSAEGLADTARRANELSQLAEPDEKFVSLPEPDEIAGLPEPVEDTVGFGPMERAGAVREVIGVAQAAGQAASGAISINHGVLAVANSLGVWAHMDDAWAEFRMVFTGEDSTGYADIETRDVRKIDAKELAQIAAEKCARSANPKEILPGDYTVILEPSAVSDMVQFLSWSAFNGLAYVEDRSPFSGRLGKPVCGKNINIWDDGLDPRGAMLAFDFEGMPKKRLDLIKDGVAHAVVYDSYTANRTEGASATGHGLPAPNSWGPIPLNVFVGAGDSSLEEMVASTERGVLVTRFHYTNFAQEKQSIITGMTRDGTFLIEDGKISCGLKNMRFTQSVLEALSNVEAISKHGRYSGHVWAPAMKINGFTFSSGTDF